MGHLKVQKSHPDWKACYIMRHFLFLALAGLPQVVPSQESHMAPDFLGNPRKVC